MVWVSIIYSLVSHVRTGGGGEGEGELSKLRVWVNTTNQNSHTISPFSSIIVFSIFLQDFFHFKLFYCFWLDFFLVMSVTKYP